MSSRQAFAVVFVCTGNRFRSPLAAGYLRRAVEGLPVEIESVGTLDVGPMRALPEAIDEAARRGLSLSRHRARPLEGGALVDADLVVAFERMHVVAAVVDGGARGERAFTLPELVELLDAMQTPASHDPILRARDLIRRADAVRPRTPRWPPQLVDPIGRPLEMQLEIAEQVRGLTYRLASSLFGVEP